MGNCQSPKCGKPLVRKTYPSGNIEPLKYFKKRKHCDPKCAAARERVYKPQVTRVCNRRQRAVMAALRAWR